MTIIVNVFYFNSNKYFITSNKNNLVDTNEWINKFRQSDDKLKVIESIEIDDRHDEDIIVIKYMAKYGIDNVRGGNFSSSIFTDGERHVINKMIKNNCTFSK